MTTVQSGPATLSAETRSPGAVATNRTLLALLGLVLLLGGLGALGLGTGLLGDARDRPVLDTPVDDWLSSHSWVWWPIAVAGVLVALVCLFWLLAQARSNRVSELRVGERTEHGRTTVSAGALTDAVADEVESYRGVQRAHAHLTGAATSPRLSLAVTLDGRVDVADVQAQILDGALVHARSALAVESLPTRLVVTVPRSVARDVR